MRIYILTLILCFTILGKVTAQEATPELKSQIDVLKGESWWGLFVGEDQKMPLSTAFSQVEVGLGQRQTVPMLISNRGRYIWSSEPFSIEFTGEKFIIESQKELIKAVTAGKTLKEAYLICVHKNIHPAGKLPDMQLINAPVYNFSFDIGYLAQNKDAENTILQYAERILAEGYPTGTFVVPNGWQSSVGSFAVNSEIFPDFGAFVAKLHGMGFRVMLTVNPYVSGDGDTFRSLMAEGGIVLSPNKLTPAMNSWQGGYSALLDFSNDNVTAQVKEKLAHIADIYKVNGFFFDCSQAMANIVTAGSDKGAHYLRNWSSLAEENSLALYSVSRNEVFSPQISGFKDAVSGEGAEGYRKRLEDEVRNIISANLLGYPFSTLNSMADQSIKDNPKAILRQMQLSAVMPTMNVTIVPWLIEDQATAKACAELIKNRAKLGAYYAEVAQEYASTAEPIIRHMEYVYPRNGFTDCDDQFMIGSKYLVAPLLGDSENRMVRLPRGTWVDSDGIRHKGPVVKTMSSKDNKLLIFELIK